MRNLIKIVVASDLHASNACFKKCLALVVETKADALVIAGDFLGKTVATFRRISGNQVCITFDDGTIKSVPQVEFSHLKTNLGDSGSYMVDVDSAEISDGNRERLRIEAGERRLKQWFDYGASKFPELPVFTVPGNDDFPELVSVIDSHPWSRNVDCRVRDFVGHAIFGFGYSNKTVWETPRELDEPEIANRLSSIVKDISDMRGAIGLIHVPPLDSGLDSAPEVVRSSDGRLQMTGTRIAVGSSEVRKFIERTTPMLVISGHCHSSGGVCKIGPTVCVNPGSAFDRGVLLARLLILEENKIIGEQRFIR